MSNNSGDTGGTSAAATSLADTRTFNDYHLSSFMAMEEMVTIVPRFSMERVPCISGTYGPFSTNYPVEVPLWLALHLRQTGTCTITLPDFLQIPYLLDIVEREKENGSNLSPLPFYFFEVAKKMCELRGDDVPSVAEVIRLVQEVKSLRQRKLQGSMAVFAPENSPMFIPGIKLTSIACNELHFLRCSFSIVLQQACEMDYRRQQLLRMPAVAAAAAGITPYSTPARTSAATAATTTMTTASSEMSGAGPSPSQPLGTLSAVSDGSVSGVDAAALSSQTTATTATTLDGAPMPQPLVQPPVKKRRTLRQT